MTMNNEPMVSVVIPIFNAEQYLMACLDSVLRQTYGSWEAICVNDGSTDGSAQILAEYANRDSRIRVITQRNAGLSAARNAGMRVARGKYILFLDSDDCLRHDALERLVATAESNELDHLVFAGEIILEDGSKDLSQVNNYYRVPKLIANQVMDGGRLFCELVRRNAFCVSAPLRLLRKDALPSDLEFPVGLIHEDNYFTPMALISACRSMVVTDAYYLRRLRQGSITTAQGQDRRHSESLAAVCRLLRAKIRTLSIRDETLFYLGEYEFQIRLVSLVYGNRRMMAKVLALIHAFRTKGFMYGLRRIYKYAKGQR